MKKLREMSLKELKEHSPRNWGEAMFRHILISSKQKEITIKRLATRWDVSYREAEKRYDKKINEEMDKIIRRMERTTKKAVERNTCKRCGGIIVNSYAQSLMLQHYGTHQCKCDWDVETLKNEGLLFSEINKDLNLI